MDFKKAREEALLRLEEDRHKATFAERAQVHGIVLTYRPPAPIRLQIKHDLRTYPFYDALAMWLDVEGGLVRAAPGVMEKIVEAFLEVTE